jgi:hypothetical protein
MVAHRRLGSSKNTRKMNLQFFLNKTILGAHWHMELDFDVHGVTGKLVIYVIHLPKNKNKNNLSLHMVPK